MSPSGDVRIPSAKFLRDLFVLSGGELAGKVIGFVAFAYLARVLDPEAYGRVEYVLGLAVFFSLLVGFGLGPIGVREIARSEDRLDRMAANIPVVRLAIALLVVPVMLLSAELSGQGAETERLVWIVSLSLFAVPWKLDWLFQTREMMGVAAAGRVIRMAVFALGAVLLVHESDQLLRVGWLEVAAALSGALWYVVMQQTTVTPVRVEASLQEFRYLLREGASVGGGKVVNAVNLYAPLFLVANLVGAAETAWFGASHRVVIALSAFGFLYHFNLYPVLNRRLAGSPDEGSELLRASFRVVAWGSVGGALLLTLLAEPLLTLAFGGKFDAAVPTFRVLVWFLPVTLLSGHARWTLIAVDRQSYLLRAELFGVGGTLAAGIPLVMLAGGWGAALAMVVGASVVWGTAHLFSRDGEHRMPPLTLVLLPALLALAGGAFASLLGAAGPWITAGLAALVYAGGALLLDRGLVRDFRRLADAKSDVASPTGRT